MLDVTIVILILALIAVTLSGVSLYKSLQTQRKVQDIFGGLQAGDEDIVASLEKYFTHVKGTDEKLETIQKNYKYLSNIAAASLQKTAIVRFNPFKNTGGDQSFVLSLLDNEDNGFMLTSIHSREGTRVYIKPIRYGTSDYTLSKEEKSALEAAMSGVSPS